MLLVETSCTASRRGTRRIITRSGDTLRINEMTFPFFESDLDLVYTLDTQRYLSLKRRLSRSAAYNIEWRKFTINSIPFLS